MLNRILLATVNAITVVVTAVISLRKWGPLVQQQMRAVISISTRSVTVTAAAIEILMSVIVVTAAVVRRRNVDPSFLPFSDRSAEHRGWTVPGR